MRTTGGGASARGSAGPFAIFIFTPSSLDEYPVRL
eukprot:COSAG04_NODE_4759_length_1906_cov_4.581546_1_plen_34_part_10